MQEGKKRKKKKTDFLKKKREEEFKNERVTTSVKKKIDLKRRKTKGNESDGDFRKREGKQQIVLLLLF